jgi:hypothetical protein
MKNIHVGGHQNEAIFGAGETFQKINRVIRKKRPMTISGKSFR